MLALANGGRIVQVFQSGTTYLEHHADRDPQELRGLVEDLGVRSSVSVPLEIDDVRRGVLAAPSSSPEFFQARDVHDLRNHLQPLTARLHVMRLTLAAG